MKTTSWRLIDCTVAEFAGPPETKRAAMQRLVNMTERRRNTQANFLRFTHCPVEVHSAHPTKLTDKGLAILDAAREGISEAGFSVRVVDPHNPIPPRHHTRGTPQQGAD